MRTAPLRTASSAGRARGSMLMNHCLLTRGSTTLPAPLAVADGVAVLLDLFQQALGLELFHDGLTAGETLHALVGAGLGGHCAVEGDGGDDG